MSQICSSCGAAWIAGAASCSQCAKPGAVALDAVNCPMCAEPVARGAATCRWCGESLGTQAAGMGAPRAGNFLPPPPPRPAAPDGTMVFVVGLLSLILCHILGPVAWIMGNSYEQRCRAMGVAPEGMAQAGKVMGIIGTILIALAVVAIAGFIGLAVIGAAASSAR